MYTCYLNSDISLFWESKSDQQLTLSISELVALMVWIFSANMLNNSKTIAAVAGLKLGDEINLTMHIILSTIQQSWNIQIMIFFSHTELKITSHDISSNEYHRVLQCPWVKIWEIIKLGSIPFRSVKLFFSHTDRDKSVITERGVYWEKWNMLTCHEIKDCIV